MHKYIRKYRRRKERDSENEKERAPHPGAVYIRYKS